VRWGVSVNLPGIHPYHRYATTPPPFYSSTHLNQNDQCTSTPRPSPTTPSETNDGVSPDVKSLFIWRWCERQLCGFRLLNTLDRRNKELYSMLEYYRLFKGQDIPYKPTPQAPLVNTDLNHRETSRWGHTERKSGLLYDLRGLMLWRSCGKSDEGAWTMGAASVGLGGGSFLPLPYIS
jgi:hypothetical protein